MERWRECFHELTKGRDEIIEEEENCNNCNEMDLKRDEELWEALIKLKVSKAFSRDNITPERMKVIYRRDGKS